MKKWIFFVLAAMILAGCTSQEEPTTVPTTEQTLPTGIYAENSPVEVATNGAVRSYDLEENGYFGVTYLGSKLLLFGNGGRLDTFVGQELTSSASFIAGDRLALGSHTVSVSTLGIAYYQDDTHDVVQLNPMLTRTNHIELPEDAEGSPAISMQTGEIYYCSGQQIRALNMQTGISRMVRSHSCQSQQITGLYFDGKILSCQLTDEQGKTRTLYFSTETGQLLSEDTGIEALVTYGQSYFIRRTDHLTPQIIFGTLESEPKQLHMTQNVASLVGMGSAVTWSVQEGNFVLELINLETGMKSARVAVPGLTEALWFAEDPGEGTVWFLAKDTAGATDLYRWDPSACLIEESTVYTTQLYTAQSPDTAAIAACKERANALGKQYGVEILIWQDALKTTGDYTLTGEYQPSAISAALDQVEATLAGYPQQILSKSMRYGKVRLSLVRDIAGSEQSAHYWNGRNAYIVMCVDSDISQELLYRVAYIVDSHALVNSKYYDLWSKQNPEGFAYSDAESAANTDTGLLSGETKAFVDAASMTSPVEDRCRIFRAACKEGNESLFTAPTMQTKLRTICLAIREAYGMEKYAEALPWEQYLAEPLA